FVLPAGDHELLTGEHGNRHLRSVATVTGYIITADNGMEGTVRGFLVDDRTWAIRRVVFVHATPASKAERLLDVGLIDYIEQSMACMHVQFPGAFLQYCPVFNPDRHVNIPYEEFLNRTGSTRRQQTGRDGHGTDR
ncbi:MAG: hypothetical protein JXA71_11885, partial [Chitinispirillaceae bacterium]|nr:hypothetical protein [Chitinispirillaceae bacterium]